MSLRYRIELTEKILRANCKGKTVVEIGCGSGRLASKVIGAGAKSYHGFDISSVAIENAINSVKDLKIKNKTKFTVANIFSLPLLKADISFSVGLIDWLSDSEIEMLITKTKGSDYLHSFSESRANPSQFLHKLYVQIAYGYRTGAYVPRYLKAGKLCKILKDYSGKVPHVIRDQRLSFGAFISTLPEYKDEVSG